MSEIAPVIILLLTMLIFASLQIAPGIFTIFYHFTSGKHSKKKSDDFAISFILGSEIFVCIIWLLIYSIIFTISYYTTFTRIIIFILAGIFAALSVISYFFYYKKLRHSSETFTPRRFVRGVINRSLSCTSRIDATLLGFFAGIPEFIFTLPLFIICSIILQNFTTVPRVSTIILSILFIVLPLLITRRFFRAGYNLAELSRLRLRAKPYVRIILSVSFLIITIFTIILGVNYG